MAYLHANTRINPAKGDKSLALVCFTGNSGLTDYSVSLARSLSPYVQVCLVTADSLLPRFRSMGFDTRLDFRRSRHYPVDYMRFVANTLRDSPDIVLFQGPLKLPLLEAASLSLFRSFGVRTALTIHDVLPHYSRWWSRAEFRSFYQSFDLLIVHSNAAGNAVLDMGVKRPILVVPHGVYDLFRLTSPSRMDARAHIGDLNEDDFVVLFFGHLEPRKGLMEFLEVAHRMRNEAGVKFVIAGGNDLAKHGSHYAQALEAAKEWSNTIIRDSRVPFEEVEHFFSASDLVALPYLEGTTSGVMKLAIAFGVPVVASSVGDMVEELPADAGILIEPGKEMPLKLESAINEVRSSYPKFDDAMKSAARNASWEPIARKYYEFMFT